MIKNIVFDMGKVLVEYEGDRVCRHFSEDEALIRKVSTAVFVSPEWLMLDMGIISEEERFKPDTGAAGYGGGEGTGEKKLCPLA
mgnify:CR=1 FL=1